MNQEQEEWKREITDHLIIDLGITNSDAQGIVGASAFKLAQEWAKGSDPATASRAIS
jgi:hypothetical protein